MHITNINRLLKGIKSKILADYICSDNKEIVIMTNKVTISSNLNIVEKYMKELNDVNLNDIISPKLSQSKFYLKILDISYFIDNTNLSIIFDIIKRVIKITYIFNNIVLAFYSQVIKIFSKSNMTIV